MMVYMFYQLNEAWLLLKLPCHYIGVAGRVRDGNHLFPVGSANNPAGIDLHHFVQWMAGPYISIRGLHSPPTKLGYLLQSFTILWLAARQ